MALFVAEYIPYCTTMGNNVMMDPTPAATTAVGNATPVVGMSLTRRCEFTVSIQLGHMDYVSAHFTQTGR